jgi:hypothetical protein
VDKARLQMGRKFLAPLPAFADAQEFRLAGLPLLQQHFFLSFEGLVFDRGCNFICRPLDPQMAQDPRRLFIWRGQQVFISNHQDAGLRVRAPMIVPGNPEPAIHLSRTAQERLGHPFQPVIFPNE